MNERVSFARDARRRDEWERLDAEGLCPECGKRDCWPRDPQSMCRKQFFDWAYSKGYHDGANNLERHGVAYIVEMMESDVYDNGERG